MSRMPPTAGLITTNAIVPTIRRPTPTVFVLDPLDPVRAAGAAAADVGAGAGATIKAVPGSIDAQCLHLIAASWISSAQYGHVFTGRL
jgi:hypothetical protein